MGMRSYGRSTLMALITCALLTGGCSHDALRAGPAQPSSQPETPPAPALDQQQKSQQVAFRWGSGWTVQVRPVFSGSTLPDSLCTITVETWENGPSKVRYEFPPFTTGSPQREVLAASDGLLRKSPTTGTITVDGAVSHAAVFTPPNLWPGGNASAPGPLIWLPPEVTASLKTSRQATLALSALPHGLTMKTAPANGPAQVTLKVASRGEAILLINGAKTRMPVVKLEDDLGSTYTVLDSSQNPLVLRFRMGPKAVVDGKRLLTGAGSGYDVVALSPPKSP